MAVVTDGCQAPVAPFDGRLGIYIDGSISPAITGVDIKVISLGESVNAQLKKGELALETKTGLDGSYSGGPLYDDTSYTVEASKVCALFQFYVVWESHLFVVALGTEIESLIAA